MCSWIFSITEIVDIKDNLVLLKETIFYPGGGGQPCDLGDIFNDNSKARVIDVFEDDKENSKIWHKIDEPSNSAGSSRKFSKGDIVYLKIDRKRRDALVKMHTAEHIFFRALQNNISDISLIKIRLDVEESTIYARAKDISWNDVLKAEKEANDIISKKLEICEHLISTSDLSRFPKLRISERIIGEKLQDDKNKLNIKVIEKQNIRVIEIDNFDWSACRGIHCNNSKDVSNILITSINKTSGFEIRFKTDCIDEILDYAGKARIASSILETDVNSVLSRLEVLKKNFEDAKSKLRELSKDASSKVNEELISNKKLIWQEFNDFDKKQLMDQAKKLAINKAIVVFFNIEHDDKKDNKKGRDDKKNDESKPKKSIMIFTAQDSEISAEQIFNKLKELGARGGGRGHFSNGMFDGSIDDVRKMINI